ncbi:MAG: hypothetical protein WC472_01620 [Candidatus Paceibacterota bacterium]
MERETKTIKTPSGKDLILKSFITVRERNELRNVIYKDLKINGGEQSLNASSIIQYEQQAIRSVIVSYDGKQEFLEELMDGKTDEYDFIVSEVNKITGEIFTQAK